MNIDEFKQKRIESRKQLLEKIVRSFKLLNPVAIHQFGSGGKGFKDEFSDIDVWVTFEDNEIDFVLKKLSKVFKDEAGENFIEYLTSIRVNEAKRLLTDCNMSMKEIGILVGYSDPNYFSRIFKKTVGITPTEFKEGNKK